MRSVTAILAGVVALLTGGAAYCNAGQFGLSDGCVGVSSSAGMNAPGDFTLEAWIRPTEFHFYGNTDDSYQSIINKWEGGSNQRSFVLDIYEDQVEIAISRTGYYADTPGIYSNTRLTLNVWTHIAGVYQDGTLALYINGVKDSATLFVPGGALQGQAAVRIGGTFDSVYHRFHGGIDDVRISDIARYGDSFTRPTAEFTPDSHAMLLMHMNEGAGAWTDNVGLLGGDGTLDGSSGWGEGAPIPEPSAFSLFAWCGILSACRIRVQRRAMAGVRDPFATS